MILDGVSYTIARIDTRWPFDLIRHSSITVRASSSIKIVNNAKLYKKAHIQIYIFQYAAISTLKINILHYYITTDVSQ